jgi:DNA-directed RNA polymerase subunit H (RpoH/RPB5)
MDQLLGFLGQTQGTGSGTSSYIRKKMLEAASLIEPKLSVIIKDETNETLLNELKHIWETDGIFIVIENIKRLQFNILNHTLVPEHRVISEKETEEIMIKYNINEKTQFPDISRFDPVARVIGLRPGQVCHIIRPSKTSITSNYYRVCI